MSQPAPSPHSFHDRARTPWVIAHRGVPGSVRENSLAGFALALDLGADGIELDVHVTRDGVAVVHHDPLLADGSAIAERAWHELRGAGDPERDVPTLADVLALVRGRGVAFVELKGRAIERAAAEVVRASGARCALHSFDHRSVRRLRDLAPELPTGALLVGRLVETVPALRAAGAGTLWQHAEEIDAELVAEVRAAGASVVAWTVNDPAEVRRLARIGVDGICTDDTRMARSALGRL